MHWHLRHLPALLLHCQRFLLLMQIIQHVLKFSHARFPVLSVEPIGLPIIPFYMLSTNPEIWKLKHRHLYFYANALFYNSKKILRQQWRLVSKIPKIITYQDICGFQIMIHIILVMEIIVQPNPNSIFFMIDIIPIFILVTWFLNLIHGDFEIFIHIYHPGYFCRINQSILVIASAGTCCNKDIPYACTTSYCRLASGKG